MMIPRNFSFAEQKMFKKQIDFWHSLLEDIAELLNDVTINSMNKINDKSRKSEAISKIWLMVDSSFRAITILNLTGHFADSFSILRILFESHLHLWNIINGDENQATKFLDLSIIQNWRLYQEMGKYRYLPELKHYFGNDFEHIRDKYNRALSTFRAKPGKILRNYTTITNKQLASLIDQNESSNEPSKSFMLIVLYASTSEIIHGTHLRIAKGYASVEQKHNDEIKRVLIPSPARGIETAWWASIIILDSIKWIAPICGIEPFADIDRVRDRIVNLANNWGDGELR